MASSVHFSTAQQFSTLSSAHSEGRDDHSPFVPATVLPEQFFDRHSRTQGGIHTLMQATLEEALSCLQPPGNSKSRRVQRLAREAEVRLVDQDKPVSMALRVTHIFRKEDDEWKLVLRHADPLMSKTAPATVLQK